MNLEIEDFCKLLNCTLPTLSMSATGRLTAFRHHTYPVLLGPFIRPLTLFSTGVLVTAFLEFMS